MPLVSKISLLDAVDEERKKAAVRPLDLSLNELADMYKNNELNISPAYQRGFRWPLDKQSQFIESLILEMPIPPLYVVELDEGKWELIDGLQRLSTYLHFKGQLNNPYRDPPITPDMFLKLDGCDIVPHLNGLTFDELPTPLQYRVRRSPMRVEVVKKETNPRFRYYMFKRLNTGGETLSEQEVRNCTIRLLDDKFNTFLQAMAEVEVLQACIEPLSDADRARMGAEELVLRFFAFKNGFDKYVHDVGPFMTKFMEGVSDPTGPDYHAFNYRNEEKVLRTTFGILAKTLGSDTCRRWGQNGAIGGFSAHHYEAFSLGVAKVFGDVEIPTDSILKSVRERMLLIKSDDQFRDLTTGGGKNSRGMYSRKIDFVTSRLREFQ